MTASNLVRRLRCRRAYSRAVRELSALDNHMLNDLGIARTTIPAIAARTKC